MEEPTFFSQSIPLVFDSEAESSTGGLPDQCHFVLNGQTGDDDQIEQFVPYSVHRWARYVFVAFLLLVYTLPILYVFSRRNQASTRARSPLTTSLCIFFIMLDSIFNTWIFSIDTKSTGSARLKCLLGVWVTMVLMIPILLTMYLRIYRVQRVFELYEKYLAVIRRRTHSVFSTYGFSNLSSKPIRDLSLLAPAGGNARHKKDFSIDTSKDRGTVTALHNGARHQQDDRSDLSCDRLRFQSENNDDKQSVLKRNLHNLDTHSNFSTSNLQASTNGDKRDSNETEIDTSTELISRQDIRINQLVESPKMTTNRKELRSSTERQRQRNSDQNEIRMTMNMSKVEILTNRDTGVTRQQKTISVSSTCKSQSGAGLNEDRYQYEMSNLREKYLLWKALWFVVIPVIVLAIFGSLFPYVQALVPVHENDVCMCLFFYDDMKGTRNFPIMSNISEVNRQAEALKAINSVMFFGVNWCFLFLNIWAVFKIRKMKDRLEIRKEMTWAVALWSFFDFFQYVFYLLTQMAACPPADDRYRRLITYAPMASYIVIITRDFCVHCVMVYFIVSVNRRESNIKAEIAKSDSKHDLHELKTVLNSCRPLMSFNDYLENNKPSHTILLDYIKLFETLQDKEIDLGEIQKEKQQTEEHLNTIYNDIEQQDEVKATLRDLEQLDYDQSEVRVSIQAEVMMLTDMFVTHRESFDHCFVEFNTTMLGGSPYSGQRLYTSPTIAQSQEGMPQSPHFVKQDPHFEALRRKQSNEDSSQEGKQTTQYAMSLHSTRPLNTQQKQASAETEASNPNYPLTKQGTSFFGQIHRQTTLRADQSKEHDSSERTTQTQMEQQIQFDSIVEVEPMIQPLILSQPEKKTNQFKPLQEGVSRTTSSQRIVSSSQTETDEDGNEIKTATEIEDSIPPTPMNLIMNQGFHTDQHQIETCDQQVDIDELYRRSFQALDWVYKAEFKKSVSYRKLEQEINENMIEYRFYSVAGLDK